MDLKRLAWDYPHPPKDDLWRARRMAEFFPFVLEELTEEDRKTLLRRLDEINVPDERKEFVRKLPSVRDIRYERLFDRRIFDVVFKDSDILITQPA